MPAPAKIEEQWKAFAATPWMDFPEKKKWRARARREPLP